LNIVTSAKSLQAYSHITQIELPDIGPVSGKLKLKNSDNKFSISNLKFIAGKEDDLNIQLHGAISELQIDEDLSVNGLDINGVLNLSTLENISSLVDISLPAVGPAQINFTVKGGSHSLSLPSIAIQLGNEKDLFVSGTGSIEQIDIRPDLRVTGVNLPIELKARSSTELTTLLGRDIPDLGPVYVKGFLKDREGNVRIDDIG